MRLYNVCDCTCATQVNGFFQTSNPDVYAVGDVAAFPLLREGGKLVRQEHVTHCRSSAAHAVQHILGETMGLIESIHMHLINNQQCAYIWRIHWPETIKAHPE